MAQLAIPVAIFAGGLYKGVQQRKQKMGEAEAYLDASDRAMAAATRDIAEEAQKRDIVHSRAIAVAAASGGAVDTPTVVNLAGDIVAEGNYNMLAAMYSGQEEAGGLSFRGREAVSEGNRLFDAAVIEGITSAVTSAYSMGAFGAPRTPPPAPTKSLPAPQMSPAAGNTAGALIPSSVPSGPSSPVANRTKLWP